ncbi:DUF4855 domain-containing protein [Paenibacillus marinisediminis]
MTSVSTASADTADKKPVPEPRNLAAGLPYVLSEAPHSAYSDSGNELTDGKYGSLEFWDQNWQGHARGKTRTVTFDLGENKSISRIKAHFLHDTAPGIMLPMDVSYYVSMDGENWGLLSHVGADTAFWKWSPPKLHDFIWDGSTDGLPRGNPHATMAYARYVKVTFTMEMFVFIDEIEIMGVDGKVQGANPVPPDHTAYLKPGQATGGIHDLVLIPNSYYPDNMGDWTKEELIPYISYVDSNGEPQDWFYDGLLFCPNYAPSYRKFATDPPANKSDWQWYADKTFAAGGDLQNLNEAVKEVGAKLGQPNHKVNVVLTIPYPVESQTDFGDVDGDGISENFNSEAIGVDAAYNNKLKTIQWHVDDLMKKWNDSNFSHLNLSGLYWLNENVEPSTPREKDLIRATSDIVHQLNLKFFWIPYFQSNSVFEWKELGFDAAALQPNHFFFQHGEYRIQDTAERIKQYGMGFEMETDEDMNKSYGLRQKYAEYLNGGVDYGYMHNTFKAYYQGILALYNASQSKDPDVRDNYEWMYQFVKGTYTKHQGGPADGSKNLVAGMSYTISAPASEGYPDSGQELTDGFFGGTDMFDWKYQGHVNGGSRDVVFDLGAEKSIGMVRADFFEYGDAAILFPEKISVSVSDDGQTWIPVGEANTIYPPGTFMKTSQTQMYVWNGSKVGIPGHPGAAKAYARYVKVTFPVERFVFLDEIEVYGLDGKTEDAVKLP